MTLTKVQQSRINHQFLYLTYSSRFLSHKNDSAMIEPLYFISPVFSIGVSRLTGHSLSLSNYLMVLSYTNYGDTSNTCSILLFVSFYIFIVLQTFIPL